MPANGRWDLIWRLEVKPVKVQCFRRVQTVI